MAAYAYGSNSLGRSTNPYDRAEAVQVRKHVFPRGSIWPWILAISLFCFALVVGMFSFVAVSSASKAKIEAKTAASCAKDFLTAAKTGDSQLLKDSAEGLSESVHEMRDEFDKPIWEFASRLPVLGSDVETVRTLVDVLIDFSDNAIMPMSESGNILSLQNFAKDDSIDFTALPGMLAALDEVMPALNRSAITLESLPGAHVPQLSSALNSAKESIVSVNTFVRRIRPLFPYLSELLGADGQTKNYLVLAQNNAEIHAIGGFVGAVGILSVTDGKIDMQDFQNQNEALALYDSYPAGATEEEVEVFGERANYHHGDHNVIPDFSRVGQLYFNIWNEYHDTEVDGVLGFDPVFLQYLLDAIGSVESKGVTLDGSDCAAIMLNQSLFWWKPKQCDTFYREVAGQALSKILGNMDDIDLSKFVSALLAAGDEYRCLIWVHDEEIESAIKQAHFGGELQHDSTKPELGVYISDRSTSKMSYYLSNDIEVSEPTTNSDGSQSYEVTATITNNFDQSARDVFPQYIHVAIHELGMRDDCDLYEEIHIIAPEGGTIESIRTERVNTKTSAGEPADTEWESHSYQGLQTEDCILRLDEKETAVVKFTVTTATDAVDRLTVRKTPLIPEEIAYWNIDLADQHPEWTLERTV